MQLKLLQEDPYAGLICKYFSSSFPKPIIPKAEELLDILTLILVGDKNLRLGPTPNPEQLVVIRKTIKSAIELNLPIPILVAWGGRKTNAVKGIDVAEVSAIHQLVRLAEAVKMYFPAGILVNIRVEDTGADWIYREESNIFDNVDNYSSQMVKMVDMLGSQYGIKVVRESWLMRRDQYFELSAYFSKLMKPLIAAKLIDETDDLLKYDEYHELEKKGWKGGIPIIQINHYIERYKALYPGLPTSSYIDMLADYLGGSKARYDLKGRGDHDTPVGSQISISFVPPIPGSPASMFSNVLYYRTIPEKDGRTHIAPWRAKGYLDIAVDNSIKVKLTNWSDNERMGLLHETTTVFMDKGEEVAIQTDYLLHEYVMPYMM